MASFPSSHFTTSRGFAYNYIHIPTVRGNKDSYILFLHGFPSSSNDWRHQIEYFSTKGYGIIAPDCLGFGATSKPHDMHAYTGKGMAKDVKEILKHEHVEKVLGVGHDWGSFLLSRLVNYYPSLFSKLVFLDVGYAAPGNGLTLETVTYVNSMVQKSMGYSVFGYFLFFQEQDAAKLMDEHPDSVRSLFYSTDEEVGKKYMGAEGGFRTWLREGQIAENGAWVSDQDEEYFRKTFSVESGGFGPSINWYKAQLANINEEDERAIPQVNCIVQQPTLLVTSSNFISVSADFPGQMKPAVPNMEVQQIDAGHWIQLQKPKETNEVLDKFFDGN